LPEIDFYLSNVFIIYKKAKYFVVRRASLHGNLLAQQSDLVVPGKRTVLSVEPCLYLYVFLSRDLTDLGVHLKVIEGCQQLDKETR
jgi:hypothetical protein